MAAEVARHFKVRTPPDVALNVPEETLPGYPGMVIREAGGERVLESMVWSFPLRLKGSQALKHWRHEAAERLLQQLRELDRRGVLEIGGDRRALDVQAQSKALPRSRAPWQRRHEVHPIRRLRRRSNANPVEACASHRYEADTITSGMRVQ